MTVYLDIIWLLNFLFDTLLLYLTALILKKDFRYFRLLAGGFIGSTIILLSFTSVGPFVSHPVIKGFFSVLMIWCTFGYIRLRTFVRTLFTFYLLTFGIGGALIGTHYFIQYDHEVTEQVLIGSVQGFGDPISWVFIILGFPIAWHFSRSRFEQIEMTKIKYDQLVDVEIKLGDCQICCKGLVDSGNQLIDPISRLPVMFLSIAQIMDQLPLAIIQLVQESEQIIQGTASLESTWEHKVRIIPMKVVGQEHQLVLALKPDSLTIASDGNIIQVEKGLVSFTLQQLSSEGLFQCILHPQMLTAKPTSSVKVS